ncbi:MAG: UDP-glucose 4-epimerase GalE [Candidatus Lambdaproteobacteria bacterium RIFOXYD1_FULL_56_27]|uniref:UDP-glucose 4-epimerase n=1 Tax=Candidatus Lambdaproteobacteria bacterium RIFOXYD2_FULL_56_26 TaxID=1817773 RepID=A0A1F6H393_9PROT|nr:MAG: UDP-glucose 4-epimerase GalE [Candidatus Lambdaproteobacteria bacterium RIFOXYC1_FULL_56_13]OGH04849.1 MAG: UDP-glucose 4-epimerase GalE [Candidatus Lambdaproteobacteria bacterium RIFOXYD2_FULL_56_26]OGH09314.1 MAG: UDP-glucose 4-epimerase GalE [Candidatus Lambdaproteobacteria bacterium RIFOXYD1_FULL_56_27]
MKGHKILIVGGAGYIGSHVALAFQEAGATVVVLDNLSTGRRENLQPGMELIEGDLQLPGLLADLFRGHFDGVIHLAAQKAAGESMVKPELYSRQNLIGSLNLLEAYAKQPQSRLIFSSTAAVYGNPVRLPMDETHPTAPVNFYGFTKLAIEGYLDWYGRLRGMQFAALRYFNAAGYDALGRIQGLEKNPQNLIPVVMEVAKGWRKNLQVFGNDYPTSDGSGVRDYIHVSDLGRAHVAAYRRLIETPGNLTVNLGTGKGYSVFEVIEETRRVSGRPIPHEVVPRREGDPPEVYASAQLAKETLGWQARESDLSNMIESTWNCYKNLP